MVTFFMVLLSILAVLSGVLMIVVIMLQNNKGGGGLGAVSGGITETMFGASAATVLVKITIWLAGIFMCSTLLLATVTGRVRGGKSVAESYIPAAVEEAPAAQVIDMAPAMQEDANANAEKAIDKAETTQPENAAQEEAAVEE